ncbi:MAG: UDP-3-O-(3-hydroxymyristoyl)glucosamine N-acyltransferase [Bacterioplanes sp.]|nr:UDP-3-O-(3-hydroxymyristoyl)glucosamine N-acyltransferase [Bacterioplanes sp.]
MPMTLAELAAHIDATLEQGDGQQPITGVNTLKSATSEHISFLANDRYRSQLHATKAGAVIVHPDFAAEVPTVALVSANPYRSFALATQLFDNRPKVVCGVHASAVVAASAQLAEGVRIAANAVIGEHVVVGANTEIGAGCVIGAGTQLGQDCCLHANVTVYHDVMIGDAVIIHSGAVIGADGFGFAPYQGRWEKIAQLGRVRIGNHVEIGANTCIDRGALEDTIIDDHVILDNLIQIAHNVHVGESCAMAAFAGVAGSTTLGKGCTIAGNGGVAGHLTLTDGVHVGPKAAITKSITEAGAYASGTAQMPMNEWRRSATRFRQLDAMAKRLQHIEKQLDNTRE